MIFVLISTSFQNFQVQGDSMDPNVQSGNYVVVNKAAYRHLEVGGWAKWIPFLDRDKDGIIALFGKPERGDVIVFKCPRSVGNNPLTPGDKCAFDVDSDQWTGRQNLIKRVIGLPGELIESRNNVIYIDGVPLEEEYITAPGGPQVTRQRVPEGRYFVMGDHRVNSRDSRYWDSVPRSFIIGKAWFKYWPASAFGRVGSLTSDPALAE